MLSKFAVIISDHSLLFLKLLATVHIHVKMAGWNTAHIPLQVKFCSVGKQPRQLEVVISLQVMLAQQESVVRLIRLLEGAKSAARQKLSRMLHTSSPSGSSRVTFFPSFSRISRSRLPLRPTVLHVKYRVSLPLLPCLKETNTV